MAHQNRKESFKYNEGITCLNKEEKIKMYNMLVNEMHLITDWLCVWSNLAINQAKHKGHVRISK